MATFYKAEAVVRALDPESPHQGPQVGWLGWDPASLRAVTDLGYLGCMGRGHTLYW